MFLTSLAVLLKAGLPFNRRQTTREQDYTNTLFVPVG